MGNFASFVPAFWIVLAFGLAISAQTKSQVSSKPAIRTPVLVELFTSEGCSSCPPADALLRGLLEQQPVPGAEIIALEEHVDYWNHDGWIDPYSSAEWTRRQQDYVALNREDPYTPQLVVDGHSLFLGNDVQKAGREIEKAAGTVKAEITITPEHTDSKNSALFKVSVGKLAPMAGVDVAEVWLAVTEDGLHSSVSRGENAGHVLQHVATLRSLQKIGTADSNAASESFTRETSVKLNSHWNPDNVRLTVFVQEKKSKQILGAAAAKVKG